MSEIYLGRSYLGLFALERSKHEHIWTIKQTFLRNWFRKRHDRSLELVEMDFLLIYYKCHRLNWFKEMSIYWEPLSSLNENLCIEISTNQSSIEIKMYTIDLH